MFICQSLMQELIKIKEGTFYSQPSTKSNQNHTNHTYERTKLVANSWRAIYSHYLITQQCACTENIKIGVSIKKC